MMKTLRDPLPLPIMLLILGLLIFQVFSFRSSADTNKDFAPYKFADVPQLEGIYKMQYQGCELFITVDNVVNGLDQTIVKTVSIATGRNCH